MIAHATSVRRAWAETVRHHRERIASAWDALQAQLALVEAYKARTCRGVDRAGRPYAARTLAQYRCRARGYETAYRDTLARLRWLALEAPMPSYRAWRDPIAAAERVDYEHDFGPRTSALDAWLRRQLAGLDL